MHLAQGADHDTITFQFNFRMNEMIGLRNPRSTNILFESCSNEDYGNYSNVANCNYSNPFRKVPGPKDMQPL